MRDQPDAHAQTRIRSEAGSGYARVTPRVMLLVTEPGRAPRF